ncbi:MAG: hypothetical protein Q4G71_03455 [Pseudomonadota bacterium]|nr:hypothetical protein [Pseudomonadota bacterium]
MSIDKAIHLGLTAKKLSRTITGTDEVSLGRSVIATGPVLAPAISVVIAVAAATGAVALIRSLWD